MDVDRDLILKNFLTETEEGFGHVEQALERLESSPQDAELIGDVFRFVHTVKGNAGILELNHLLAFAHRVEDLLDEIRKHRVCATPETVSTVLASIDVLREMIAAAGCGKDDPSPRAAEVLQRVSQLLGEGKLPQTKIERDSGASADVHSSSAGTQAGSSQRIVRTLRVDVEKLDRLLDLTGEIAIARGRISRLLENASERGLEEIHEAHSVVDTLQGELQEIVLKARMVSVGPVFRQYARTVRDLAKDLGKLARLQIEGEEVEVDTSVVEHLKDPLLHMIRNAVDHGIESPDERRKAGKPPVGTIVVRASYQAGGIAVEVEDDGAGIDRQRTLEVAQRNGLSMDAGRMTDHDVEQLVFDSGFSTAQRVSNVSGRGVGLDVVRRNVQALRGNVQISSRPGLGCTVHIRFPLTLAIIEGFAVEVNGDRYVIPLDHVVECVDLPRSERASDGQSGIISLRGESLPYLDLGQYFGRGGANENRQSLVIVRHDSQRAGIAVDRLLGGTQAVIKPLGRVLQHLPWASGSTILGDGRVAFIVDVALLLREFCTRERQAA
jgi:two-component system chemotaxis sensor kinase CheA